MIFFLLNSIFLFKKNDSTKKIDIVIEEKPNLNCGTVFNQKKILEKLNNNKTSLSFLY